MTTNPDRRGSRAAGRHPLIPGRPHGLWGDSGAGSAAPEEIEHLDGIVLPGGESTTIDKLFRLFGSAGRWSPAAVRAPAYGRGLGSILLAEEVLDGTADQQAFGRTGHHRPAQRVRPAGGVVRGRRRGWRGCRTGRCMRCSSAPPGWRRCMTGSRCWGRSSRRAPKRPTSSRSGRAVCWPRGSHPEVTADRRIHRYFLDLVRAA